MSKEKFLSNLDEAWFNWKQIPPVEEDLSEKISKMQRLGQVDIVTARSEVTVPFAKEWLHFQKIPYTHFVRAESTVAKSYLNYDFFIDDSANLMPLIASRLFGYGILYEQPWNRTMPNIPRIHRIKKMKDALPFLTRQGRYL